MIVAFGQLVQPASPEEVFEAARGTLVTDALDWATFRAHFGRLERGRYFWRTEAGGFVVTPKGDRLARASLDARTRDKLRLLILNRRRYR